MAFTRNPFVRRHGFTSRRFLVTSRRRVRGWPWALLLLLPLLSLLLQIPTLSHQFPDLMSLLMVPVIAGLVRLLVVEGKALNRRC